MKTKHLIPLVAGLGLLCACKGKMSSSLSADTLKNAGEIVSKSPTADSVSPEKIVFRKSTADISVRRVPVHKSHGTDTVQPVRRVVQKADIHFKVKSVQQTAEQVAAITADLKGSVVHQTINSAPQSQQDFKRGEDSITRVTITRPTAEMTVKVPPTYLEVFLLQVTRMGIHIDSSHLNVNDKTYEYLSTQLKLKNKAGELAARENKPELKNTLETQVLKENIADERIKNLRLADSAKTGIVMLSFYENDVVTKEILANTNPDTYDEPAAHRIVTSVKEGWDVFIDFIAIVIKVWVLLPLGLVTWFFIKRFNKKKTTITFNTNAE